MIDAILDKRLAMIMAHVERTLAGPEDVEPRGPESALVWLPPIIAAGLSVPHTEVVEVVHRDCVALLDGEVAPGLPVEALKAAAARVGYPCFLRTDVMSGKHDGPGAYRVTGPDSVLRALALTIQAQECAFGTPRAQAVLLRQWLDLDGSFRAFGPRDGEGHLIAREWRLFASAEGVECSHFYWPADAIEGKAGAGDWRELLEALGEPPAEIDELERRAVQAARALQDDGVAQRRWSVDFALDTGGRWWLIDMAPAERSWHPECARQQGAIAK